MLDGLVRGHFATFRARAVSLRDREGLPRVVESEDGACGHDRLVPFSCKGRGFCPPCGGTLTARYLPRNRSHY